MSRPRTDSAVTDASAGTSRGRASSGTNARQASLDTAVDVNQLVPAESVYAFGAEFQAATLAKGDGLSEAEFVEMLLKYLDHDSDEESSGEDDTAGSNGGEGTDGVSTPGTATPKSRFARQGTWRRRRRARSPSPRSRLRREFRRRQVVQKKRRKSELVVDLCELFAQIDVNGDGTVEWPEFTSFCVEAGMVASREVARPTK